MAEASVCPNFAGIRACATDPIRPSRNSWILRAIAEKLEREEK
jgi:hypothetical protein